MEIVFKIIRLPFAIPLYPLMYIAGRILGDSPKKVHEVLDGFIWENEI